MTRRARWAALITSPWTEAPRVERTCSPAYAMATAELDRTAIVVGFSGRL